MKQILAVAVLMCVTGCASVGAQTTQDQQKSTPSTHCQDCFEHTPTPNPLPTALSAIKAAKRRKVKQPIGVELSITHPNKLTVVDPNGVAGAICEYSMGIVIECKLVNNFSVTDLVNAWLWYERSRGVK